MAILLSVIWTSHLASGIKAAVTVTIVLLAVVAGAAQGIYALISVARDVSSDSGSDTESKVSSVSD